MTRTTVWVFGDQLNRGIGALDSTEPAQDRVLMVESAAMVNRPGFHRQRLHLVMTAMRRFADELRTAGYEVDYRKAATLRRGLEAHREEFSPDRVVATEPNSREVAALVSALDIELTRSNQFLCHRDDFADWVGDRTTLRMEDFYRWQRRRLGYLMDGDHPAGGRWNYDEDNREPSPADGGTWPEPVRSRLDELDATVLAELPDEAPGADPVGWWATSRRAALARLRHFVSEVLPIFGPYEDAMLADNWHLAHSLLSPYLNLGLIGPEEVCDEVEAAYRAGDVPINSAEGVIRQIIGWREFVWGIYWMWPEQYDANVLDHARKLPPVWEGTATTDIRCVAIALDGLEERAWIHHIQRLMVLANFANLYGMDPRLVRDWMRARYVDGGNWVMGPNVMGMGLWADGGRMSTKPYVSGGAYINRMSDYCSGCRFDPKKRTGEDACPFTTLYWDFLARNEETLGENARMARQYHTLHRLSDVDAVRERAAEVMAAIADGRL